MDLSSIPFVNYSNGSSTVQPFQNQGPISLGNYQVNNGGQMPDFNAIFSQFTNPTSFDPNVARFLAQPTQNSLQPPLINGIPVAGGSVGPTGWQGGYNNSLNTQISTFSSAPGPVISNGQFIGSLPTTTNYTQPPTQNYVNLGNLLNQTPQAPFQNVGGGYNNPIFNNFTFPQQPRFPQQFPFNNQPLPWQSPVGQFPQQPQFPQQFPFNNQPLPWQSPIGQFPQQPQLPWGQSFPQIPQFQQPTFQFPSTFSPSGYQTAYNNYRNDFNTSWNTYQGQLNQTFGQFPGYQPLNQQFQLPDLSQTFAQYPPLPTYNTSQVTVNGQTTTTPSSNVVVTDNGLQTF